MFSKEKKTKSISPVFILLLIIGGMYIHGFRVVDLSENPSSVRPWKVVISGEYQPG